VEAIRKVASEGWISSTGPEVQRFEKDFADYIGTENAVSCSSGTTALHLALKAGGIGAGDEVIVPDLTFIASASMIVACGATPVFADVSSSDWNLSAESVSRCLSPRTRAIMPVHLYGNSADCEAIAQAAPGTWIIEDAAEAFGASRYGRKVGTFGRVGCFSFYGNKIITTGEGGMVVTDNAEMATRMRLLRGHAMSPGARYYHAELGFNYRMTALQAALGRSQLARVQNILERKCRIANWYAESLGDIPEVTLHPAGTAQTRSIFWMYSILLPTAEVRDQMIAELSASGVDTRPFFLPMSTLPPFRPQVVHNPVSRSLSERGLNLPSGPLLTEAEISFVADTIRHVLGRGGRGVVTSFPTLEHAA
jgi:perosamine synthetase